MMILAFSLWATFGRVALAKTEPAWNCEGSLAAEVRTLNVLWYAYDELRRRHAEGDPTPAPETTDFKSYAEAKRFLQSLMFVHGFDRAKQNDAEAVQTYLMWRYDRRRLAFEENGRRAAAVYGLANALDQLGEYIAHERYAQMIGGPLGRPSRLHLDIRVQPHLPRTFWPTVSSTLHSGILEDGDNSLYFVKYNGFVHVLRPEGAGKQTDYAVYKIANRANVGSPLHFAYFLELMHDDLGSDLEHMTDLQDLFFNRHYLLRDLLPTGAPQP